MMPETGFFDLPIEERWPTADEAVEIGGAVREVRADGGSDPYVCDFCGLEHQTVGAAVECCSEVLANEDPDDPDTPVDAGEGIATDGGSEPRWIQCVVCGNRYRADKRDRCPSCRHSSLDDFATDGGPPANCPRCGDPVSGYSTTGPSEHRAQPCGCQISTLADGGVLLDSVREQRDDLTLFQLRILSILADESRYGLAIKDALAEGVYLNRVYHGRLYHNLGQLDDRGLIEISDRPSSRTKSYALTDAGRDVLEAEIDWLSPDGGPTGSYLPESTVEGGSDD